MRGGDRREGRKLMESLSLQRRAGFTFLEVMIVVMIIGILAAMAVPGLAGAADAAKEVRIRSDLQTIGSAVELYHVQHGAYPDSLDVLAESGNGKEGYLKSVPESPDEKTSYTLNTSTGEVTCTFNNKTYSSYGTSKASSGA